jgi:dihydroorotase
MIDWKDKREFWIEGARLADPVSGKIRTGSMLVRKGMIGEIAWQKKVKTDLPVLAADGLLLAPGFIDIHTHLREPGFEDKETIETGTAAAAAGGYTAVVCMANTDPVIDDPSVVEFVLRRASESGSCRVYVTAAVTRGLEGNEICEYHHLKKAGAVALSDDGRWITNSRVMRSALEYSAMHGMTVVSHCEDPYLTAGTQMNESYWSTKLGLKGAHAVSEVIAVDRDIRLADLTGSMLHIAHVSTAGAVELIRSAKKRGVAVTAEATPHHLTLNESMIENYDRNLRVSPPLRGKKDVSSLRAALRDGTIDCVATDHAPHTAIDKQVEFDLAPPGMIGLETAFALLNTELVVKGEIELIDLVRLLTSGPADVLGLPGGRIIVDEPADLVLIDTGERWIPGRSNLRSKSINTPLLGRELIGKVQGVFIEGKWKSADI